MSLGFGRVAPQDWDALKSGGFGGDKVDPGDYIVVVGETRHMEPTEKSKGQGVFFTKFKITEENAAFVGKTVERGFRYHPNPPNEKLTQMNGISEQEMAKLVAACNCEPMIGPDGMIDLVGSVRQLGQLGLKCKLSVSHNVTDGKTYQEISGFSPLM
jgi:hypothetical protein